MAIDLFSDMNLFELVLKQMRQRSLSTWLTVFSILLAVGLAIAIMILHREGKNVFGQSDYGFDTVIGVKGSRLQLVLNSVYHIDQSPGNLDYAFYEKLTTQPTYRRLIKWAVPIAVGDSYRNHRVVASTPAMRKHSAIASDGKPANIFSRFIRSSFTAATIRPSTSSAAPES